MGCQKIYELAEKMGNQTAEMTCWIGYHHHDQMEYWKASVQGKIVPPFGRGYGFDPIFVPMEKDGTFGKFTYAEMSNEQYDIRHPRYHVIKKLCEFIDAEED
jgi:inosine/xanthosine triphosphate pyrophosphatase family protein